MASSDRLIEVFNAAKTRPAGCERERVLDEAALGDPELREQVASLLLAHDAAGDFLGHPLFSAAGWTSTGTGDRICRYQLRGVLGEGGSGVVYLADQQAPVRRRVAVKVIKLGMDTRQVVARFEGERQALALMDHPNIAKVLDAGTTEAGRPYFVMELVRGSRITEYCDQNRLDIGERLGLFIKVCQAIQHAHQKGIIHRDIKPSNILVTLLDGVPVPKVIDFGIAKATEERYGHGTVYTHLLHFIGTPAYMSPEQAGMTGVDIDTRSDIYSLGVLLYELLTGNTPFDPGELMASGIDAMRKTIREKEPVRPSTRLARGLSIPDPGLHRSATAPSNPAPVGVNADSTRRMGLRARIHRVRGDLDSIVMKCLEKDRARRYETANGLAVDLQRHLSDEPIVARRSTAFYRFRKLVRRNRLAFSAVAAVAASLLLGLAFAAAQGVRAVSAEGVAGRNAYALEVNAAFHALSENNLGRARDLLGRQRPKPGARDDLRGFEWRLLWRLCQGDEFHTFTDEGARATAFSPDGRLLAYSGGSIVVREAVSWKVIATLPGPGETLSFAPHSHLLASAHEAGVRIWNTDTWQLERSIPDTMEPCLFSPGGHYFLTGVAGAFRLWDAQTWQPVGDCPGAPRYSWHGRYTVAFSPDDRLLVTVAGDREMGQALRVWRLPGLERLPDLRFDEHGDCRPGSAAFTADGRRVVVGLKDGRMVVWDLATGMPTLTTKEHTAWVTAVVVHPGGGTIASASCDRTLALWDATSFAHRSRLRGHVKAVLSMALSPDGRTLVSGSQDGSTKLWRVGAQAPAPVLQGFGLVAGFTGGGAQVVAVASNRWCVWTPASDARVEFPFPEVPGVITEGTPYAVFPATPLGALGRADGLLELWSLATGARVAAWLAHRDGISAIACSSDGTRLATATTGGEVKVWDPVTRMEVARFGPVGCLLGCLAFSQDGRTLAGSGICGSVWLWEVAGAGNEFRKLTGHSALVASVAFSPDGRLLASSSMDDEVRLWSLPSGGASGMLSGHVDAVSSVAFSPDGRTLVTGGLDKRLMLWSVTTKQVLATFPITAQFPMLRFSPDGRILAIGDMVGEKPCIRVLQAPTLQEVAEEEAKVALPEPAAMRRME